MKWLGVYRLPLLLQTCVFCCHEVLQVLLLLGGDGWHEFVFVVIIEDLREHIGDSLLRFAHRMDGSVDVFGYELMEQAVATTVAVDDEVRFPITQIVQVLTKSEAKRS